MIGMGNRQDEALREMSKESKSPNAAEPPTMLIDSHSPGLALTSRKIPRKKAIRIPRETFRNGSRNWPSSSGLIAFRALYALRIARIRLAVMPPNGDMRRRAAAATFAQARPDADIWMTR